MGGSRSRCLHLTILSYFVVEFCIVNVCQQAKSVILLLSHKYIKIKYKFEKKDMIWLYENSGIVRSNIHYERSTGSSGQTV